ncbi:MAG: hypothetical protein M9891_06405 [Austwickia sp.]|nr:hypothetical protein [Actinomycetota bacterium]MCB1255315.1 hypothetical protein [Austwickia sp.]MCO5308906.1 hypothetical protein [Austwickia sp.]
MTDAKDKAVVGDIARQISSAPLPTEATLRRRQSLPLQTLRFAALNARIMRMVLKGHHGT